MTQSIEERFQDCLKGWHDGNDVLGNIVHTVLDCIEKSSDASFFLRAPEEAKRDIVSIMDSFRQNGYSEIIILHTGLYVDNTPEMRKILSVLAKENLVDGEEIRVVAPPPVIEGLESIVDGAQLQEILSFEPRLLDYYIEAYSIGQGRPSFYKNQAEFSMLVTHNIRAWQSETSFHRISKSRWLATFSLSHAIGEPAPERHIVERPFISVFPHLSGRRKYFEVKIYDLFRHALALTCEEIRLTSLVQLPIGDGE